jgi:hypothetical protein
MSVTIADMGQRPQPLTPPDPLAKYLRDRQKLIEQGKAKNIFVEPPPVAQTITPKVPRELGLRKRGVSL